ncbi:MAG: antibiotic biosynthesis monooxygenase [Chroococcidiopsidaceae cyanobacterium CP_BM_RX_35]|nr:antibiotic biosynthesis monooxygenase [Chroococcidiopsidaceae cyanobacterium CP_BM_RX_35]
MSSSVVLINVFVVPKGKEEEFISTWKETAQQMKNQPGFIDTKLHRSLDSDARFQFINVAHWESPESWQAAMAQVQPKESSGKTSFKVEANPALYQVEVQY